MYENCKQASQESNPLSVTIEQALVLLNQLLQQQLQLCVCSVCNNSCNCVCVKWDQTSCCIMLVVEARPLLSMHGPCSITRCRCRPILRLDNMVALVRRRELVNITGAHAVVVEARPLPKVAGYTVPRSFAVAFGSEDKCCCHLFDTS